MVAGSNGRAITRGVSAVAALGLAGLLLAPAADSSPNTDRYGGYVDLPAPGGATGFFRVEKVGNRWVFVTPAGHAFWYRGVQNIGDYFFVPGKYATKEEWGVQVRRRLKRWGFNAVGEYGAAAVSFGTVERMPFVHLFRPANNAMRNTGGFAAEPVKEIIGNIPTTTYNGWRGILIDAFDPKYPAYAAAFFDSAYNYRWLPGGPSGEAKDNPWLIGYATEDGDEWFGVTGGAAPDPNVIKPHPAWSVLVSAHPMAASANPGGYGPRTYTDRTNYSKLALRDFLKARYGSDLAALNAAWASRYTSWDQAGGYGVGSGLLDEAGQNPWVCTERPCPPADWNELRAMTPAARKDLDDFLERFTERLASVAVQAIRAKDPNHLIFSPDTTNQWGYVNRPPILRAMARWFDVLHVGYQEGPVFSAERKASVGQTYDLTGKPMITWVGITANADSAMAAHPDPFGVDSAPTQAARGEKYRMYVTNLLQARGANGDYPVVGLDFWGWMDQTNESANWGLVSLKDNAYDGREAVVAAGTDPWGYPTGGEKRNFGDFLGAVSRANAGVHGVLAATILAGRKRP